MTLMLREIIIIKIKQKVDRYRAQYQKKYERGNTKPAVITSFFSWWFLKRDEKNRKKERKRETIT